MMLHVYLFNDMMSLYSTFLIRYCLKSAKAFVIGTDCFLPCMKAARRGGMVKDALMACSTVSLNFAGCAVSRNTPVSPDVKFSVNARQPHAP